MMLAITDGDTGAWKIFWTVIGWTGNAIFASRFYVQWYATEKKKQVVVPSLFWWLSLVGSLVLLVYALFHNKDLVIVFGFAFSWIPYTRNLIIHYRHKARFRECPQCGQGSPPGANYCSACGTRVAPVEAK